MRVICSNNILGTTPANEPIPHGHSIVSKIRTSNIVVIMNLNGRVKRNLPTEHGLIPLEPATKVWIDFNDPLVIF